MSAAVHRAIKDWVCLTGINWFVKDTVMKQGSSVDSTSLIYLNDFSGGDIIAKFEGNNSERCFDGSDFFAYHKELDIRISRDFTNNNKIDDWFYDLTRLKPVPNREIDFYAVITHELGHAFNLGHLIEKDIMYWSNSSSFMGSSKRVQWNYCDRRKRCKELREYNIV